MARAFLIILDSVGCGGAKDASLYGDDGANTLGHIAEACAKGEADRKDVRQGPLHLPHLNALGLSAACEYATGKRLPLSPTPLHSECFFGAAQEISKGKDTISGHWEIAGAPADFAFGYFKEIQNSFPPDLIEAICREGHIAGIIGNCHASGTLIIEEHGEAHIKTGKPIIYTSADSVIQIAAHETHFGLTRLYALCEIVRRLVDPLKIGRVIARPFIGETSKTFSRTANRKDFSIPPPQGTLLDRADADRRSIITLGKIGDIFTHRATGREVKAAGNEALFDALLQEADTLADGGLLFANFVDFDSEFGHRRDVAGYAACLEAFDRRVPSLLEKMRDDDLLLFTADHGNDPTWTGTDHTREAVPIVGLAKGRTPRTVGLRQSLADTGASVAQWLDLPPGPQGHGWFSCAPPPK
jgi:phosphopentomutase